MPCYHCGMRQVDPDRGASPWTRGVLHDHQILVCPACQAQRDWTAELDRCGRCASAHLVRRLDEVECRDCGLIRLTGADHAAEAEHTCLESGAGAAASADTGSGSGAAVAGAVPAARKAGLPAQPDPELAAEVERALAKVLGKTAKIVAAP